MSRYADSSFLASCYVVDAHTPRAKTALAGLHDPLIFTALHELEVRNAFQLGVFRRLLSVQEAAAAWANLQRDLRAGRLVKTIVKWPAVFRLAARLSKRHSMSTGTRSLDILHVATARKLRVAEFLSFDTRQINLASAVGLKLWSAES
jgi:predicted nucleic acid-binding protein